MRGACLALTERIGHSLVQQAEALDLGGLLDTETQCLHLCALTAGVAAPESSAQRAPRWLRRCRERLVDESEQALRLGDLAREAGVHPVSLARAFRRHYGLSPGQLQRRGQLNRAAHPAPASLPRIALFDMRIAPSDLSGRQPAAKCRVPARS